MLYRRANAEPRSQLPQTPKQQLCLALQGLRHELFSAKASRRRGWHRANKDGACPMHDHHARGNGVKRVPVGSRMPGARLGLFAPAAGGSLVGRLKER